MLLLLCVMAVSTAIKRIHHASYYHVDDSSVFFGIRFLMNLLSCFVLFFFGFIRIKGEKGKGPNK